VYFVIVNNIIELIKLHHYNHININKKQGIKPMKFCQPISYLKTKKVLPAPELCIMSMFSSCALVPLFIT